MVGSNSSKDTQEEKPRLNQTDWPSCLNLDVLTKELWTKSDSELYTGNVVLSCMKVPKDEGPGEKRTCPRYTCISGLTPLDCSAISSMHTYHPLQCHKAGQAGGATSEEEARPRTSLCRAKSYEDFKNIDLCCHPEVLQDVTLEMEKLLANEKQQLITVDPQEANLDHQTPETPRHHRTSRRISRRSREWRDLGSPTPMLDQPTPTHIPLCLGTSLDHQHPRLGQESSQGWVTAVGILGALGFLVLLGFLVVRWWRGRREERRSHRRCWARGRMGWGEPH